MLSHFYLMAAETIIIEMEHRNLQCVSRNRLTNFGNFSSGGFLGGKSKIFGRDFFGIFIPLGGGVAQMRQVTQF